MLIAAPIGATLLEGPRPDDHHDRNASRRARRGHVVGGHYRRDLRSHREAQRSGRFSSRSDQSPRPWRSRNACTAPGPRASPSTAFHVSSKTISMSRGCPRAQLVPPSPIAEKSAFVVEKLERAGAIVIGKTNLDQFATGLVGVRSPYGVPRNALRAVNTWRIELRLGGGGWSGPRPLFAWH